MAPNRKCDFTMSAVAAIGKGHVKWCPCDEFAGYSEVKQRSEPQLETRVPDSLSASFTFGHVDLFRQYRSSQSYHPGHSGYRFANNCLDEWITDRQPVSNPAKLQAEPA
ncbi:hypothetical protein RRG08_015344 [Elysia crispata]|uniref:Uncharacterized protein n=1 Tax=Elysia crispata TaxID=231223 RepID=A0AAE1A7Z8_9GAST|nr:hypothetical protein RRG08_015344 [Elysia crispata]